MIACSHRKPWWPYGSRGHGDPRPHHPAIRLDQLQVTYPGAVRPALVRLALEVACGERVALVGANGAGKSTLLKTVAGLLHPQAGTIELYGNPVGACHHRTAYLPQRADLDWQFPLRVVDLVMTGRYVHLGWLRWPGKQDHHCVSEALERLGLDRLAGRQISQLSGGQQQRVLLARALVQDASLFLLDEPLNAVDQATRDVIDQVLLEHARSGGTVLAATHDLGGLAESFDRAVHLEQGTILAVTDSPVASRTAASIFTCTSHVH